MIIYRLEHSGCGGHNKHHGPHTILQDCAEFPPPFGSSGPPPQEDIPSLPMNSIMWCGVLRHQVASWWHAKPTKIAGWDFAVYDVENYFEGVRQVTFKIKEAIFLCYFPGWVGYKGELDTRYPDEFFQTKYGDSLCKSESGSPMSGFAESIQPSFP